MDHAGSSLPRNRSMGSRENSSLSAGCIKEFDSLLREVSPLPESSNLSPKGVDEIMQSCAKIMGDSSVDWKKRVTSLKRLRSLCADSNHHAQIMGFIRHMVPPLQQAVKDVRSQVSREACITVGSLSQSLGNRAEILVEPLLTTLFTLLIANAKVISITGTSVILAIYGVVFSHRLIPPLQVQMKQKSKEIRRVVCMVVKIVLAKWPSSIYNRYLSMLQEIIQKGVSDADGETRAIARECFVEFRNGYPDISQVIYDSLELHQKKQLDAILSGAIDASLHACGSNGAVNHGSFSRQGSLKRTNIPVLSRCTPSQATKSGRSSSAIDLQAADRARANHLARNNIRQRTPLRYMGRTNSSVATPSTYNRPNMTPSPLPTNHAASPAGERSRQRIRPSRLSHSQPGSRSNSPVSKYSFGTYKSPYSQGNWDGCPSSLVSPPAPKPARRFSAASSASSSRDSSPQNRHYSKRQNRFMHQTPQFNYAEDSPTMKMLLASRECEKELIGYQRDLKTENDFDNHSDSEDSIASHRSFRSETFSPTGVSRSYLSEDVEELIKKCGSAKWSERKEGLLGIQNYLNKYGSLPAQYFTRIGQTFCRIFMDAHTKVLSLFLDVLHVLLLVHADDLVDFTTILLNRVLTKLGSDLLTSVHSKLMKTLDIIMQRMPANLQFSAVAHYLCDPTQTPNSRSRVSALWHLNNLCAAPVNAKYEEIRNLAEKILEWSSDSRSHELRKMSQKVFHSLYDMATPTMTLVLSDLPGSKQDQAKIILQSQVAAYNSHQSEKRGGEVVDGGNSSPRWSSIHSDLQSLELRSETQNDLEHILSEISSNANGRKGSFNVDQLLIALKEATDDKILLHHKEILKLLFDSMSGDLKASEKALCFECLDEMCKRKSLSNSLVAFAELFIVKVTDIQGGNTARREITKAAENCGMSIASNFPPEILVRALCPIVQNKEYPVNQMAIKMLQRVSESSEVQKLRALCPDMISTLIAAYDHPDSAVRKAAVFALVALHLKLGSELHPYISALSGSKLKLLQLYIQRAEQQNSHVKS